MGDTTSNNYRAMGRVITLSTILLLLAATIVALSSAAIEWDEEFNDALDAISSVDTEIQVQEAATESVNNDYHKALKKQHTAQKIADLLPIEQAPRISSKRRSWRRRSGTSVAVLLIRIVVGSSVASCVSKASTVHGNITVRLGSDASKDGMTNLLLRDNTDIMFLL